MTRKPKFHVGWIGIVDGSPYLERINDNYCDGIERVRLLEVFLTKKDASKRFQLVKRITFSISAERDPKDRGSKR